MNITKEFYFLMSNLSFGKLASREINIGDAEIFRRNAETSFYSFSNIYAWRSVMNYRVCDVDGFPALIGKYRNEPYILLPPFYSDEISPSELLSKVSNAPIENVMLCPVLPDMLPEIKQSLPSAEITQRRDLSDYFYSANDLISLSGKKFHQKKNHLNSFVSKYSYTYIPVHTGDRDAQALLKKAQNELYSEIEKSLDLDDEQNAISELIANFDALRLVAGVIICEGKTVAYSIGEKISQDTALVHIEKADRNFSGSYAAINNMLAKSEFADCAYINREEDMGIEGLRKAKLSYHPAYLGEYYSVKI